MGYTTDFEGAIEITPKLNDAQVKYINQFSHTRRMGRNNEVNKLSDPIREAVNLPAGLEGGFFVGGDGYQGQDKDDSIINYNTPPRGQPGLWCQWVIDEHEGKQYLIWDGGEKFYNYVEWLEYMITWFFKPWNASLNGEIGWQGEEHDDIGIIRVSDSNVKIGAMA